MERTRICEWFAVPAQNQKNTNHLVCAFIFADSENLKAICYFAIQ